MATSFSSGDKEVISRTIEAQSKDLGLYSVEDVFEIERCVEWIEREGLARVALQFPDSLLHAAPQVAKLIQEKLGREVFILGDTSFGECCVDEVAAQHLQADGVIHFGHTCLTPPEKLPVLYVFTRSDAAVNLLCDSIRERFPLEENLLLLYDVEYDHLLRHFALDGWKGKVVVGQPSRFEEESVECDVLRKFGRQFHGIRTWDQLQQFKIVFVGSGEERLLHYLYSFGRDEFWIFEKNCLVPAVHSVSKLLMRRYFLVEKAKDAERVGILVGTLAAQNYMEIIDSLRRSIRGAGKKCYTFLVGKLNVAKLANFPEIDIFVLVACPETSFPDTKEYFQSIISPYELEIACSGGRREWGGEYHSDYRDLLPGGRGFVAPPTPRQEGEDGEEEEEEPDISLVTGRVRGGRHGGVGESGELAVINDRTVGILHQGGGGEYLATRSWSGLEQALGQTEVMGVVEGRSGIAAGYKGEAS